MYELIKSVNRNLLTICKKRDFNLNTKLRENQVLPTFTVSKVSPHIYFIS